MKKGADITSDSIYRYFLWRQWDTFGRVVVWIMLNPSTADAHLDDPTIRRCIGFAKLWGYSRIEVVNLFALRSSSPMALLEREEDPIGPVNNYTLRRVLRLAKTNSTSVIAAWGALKKPFRQRALDVVTMCDDAGIELLCLGHTKGGYPRHPLYTKKNQKRVPLEEEKCPMSP